MCRNKAHGEKKMQIKIIPAARDEEKIAEIKNAMQTKSGDDWQAYCCDLLSANDEWFDAMYHAIEDGDTVLSVWEDILYDILMDDKRFYFASDLCGFEA